MLQSPGLSDDKSKQMRAVFAEGDAKRSRILKMVHGMLQQPEECGIRSLGDLLTFVTKEMKSVTDWENNQELMILGDG